MKITLSSNELEKVIKNYYLEKEEIEVDSYITATRDNNRTIKAVVIKTIEYAGMSFNSEMELDEIELIEILNYFATEDFNIAGYEFESYENYDVRGDSYTNYRVNIEIEPVQQKTRNKGI